MGGYKVIEKLTHSDLEFYFIELRSNKWFNFLSILFLFRNFSFREMQKNKSRAPIFFYTR